MCMVGCLPGPGQGTSMVPSCLWLIRDRWTVTSPKVVLKVNGRVPALIRRGFAAAVRRTSSWSAFSMRARKSRRGSEGRPDGRTPRSGRGGPRPGTARAGTSPATAAARRPDRPCRTAQIAMGQGRRWRAWCISIPVLWGVYRACFFIARAGRAASPERNRSGNQPPILCILPLIATNSRRSAAKSPQICVLRRDSGSAPPKRILVPSSRGDRTPLELFRSGVQGLPATIRAALCQAATG